MIIKKAVLATAVSGFMLTASAVAAEVALETDDQKTVYAIGYNIGQSLARDFDELDSKAFAAGLDAGFEGRENPLSEEEVKALFARQQERAAEKKRARQAAAIQAGEAFLAENAKKDGVKVTASGLQYIVLEEGSGKSPSADSNVKVHYHGTLPDGRVFDSSVERGQPAEFGLGNVIKGWTEGLQLMKEGAKYQFVVPSNLAYGSRQVSPLIPPHQVLVFDVELLEVK